MSHRVETRRRAAKLSGPARRHASRRDIIENMSAHTKLVRVINEDQEVACVHRDLSVCKDCWAKTPGLIDVYDVVYLDDPRDRPEVDGANVRLSPGTRV